MKIHMTAVSDKLGPYKRFVIWVQGCDLGCPGCVAFRTHDFEGGREVSVTDLYNEITKAKGIEGLTISGGEPTYKAIELNSLIEKLRSNNLNLGVIMYTGFTLEEIVNQNNPDVLKLISYCDIVIDGRYIKKLDKNKGLKGSSNQVVNQLSNRYQHFVKDLYYESARKIEIQYNANQIKIIGLPSEETKVLFDRWED